MFGVSFVEFLVIAIAAILFIGPEKLPELAQKLGGYLRQFRNIREDFTHKMYQPNDWMNHNTKNPTNPKTTSQTPSEPAPKT